MKICRKGENCLKIYAKWVKREENCQCIGDRETRLIYNAALGFQGEFTAAKEPVAAQCIGL